MMCLKDTDLIWKTFYLGSMSTISKLPFPLSPQISGLPAGPTCSEACWTLLQQQLEELNRFYALRSFRLGLRTGLALARDLEDGPLTPPPPSEGGLP